MKHSSSLRNFAIGAALSALTIGAVAAQDATPEATPETTPAAQAGSTTDQAQPRPYLGVQISNTPDGITVVDVMPGSPAADAGLLPGDIITHFNDETVADAQALSLAISTLQPGAAVTLEVTRGTDTITAEATLGTAPQRPVGQGQPGRNGDGQGQPGRNGDGQGPRGRNGGQMMPFGMGGFFLQNGRLGVAFITLDAQSAQENNVEQTDGALVTQVQENSPAQAAGLQVDDVITAVNGEPVDAERTLRDRLIAYEPGDTVTLTIERAGAEQQIEATLGQPEIGEGMMPGFRFMMPDGMMPNGMMPNDMMPNGMMPNGTLPDATPEMPATGNANA